MHIKSKMRLFRYTFSEGTTTVRIDWNLKAMRSTRGHIKLFDALFFSGFLDFSNIVPNIKPHGPFLPC